MSEREIAIPPAGLIGMLSTPGSNVGEIAVLIVNAGVVLRTGPHRLHVRVARQLAATGIASLRFDLSGLGDSPHTAREQAQGGEPLGDIIAAMDYVQRSLGCRRFAVVGLCSGAVHALEVARRDVRVVGAVLIDGYLYRNSRAATRYFYWNVSRREGWRRLSRIVSMGLARLVRPQPQPGASLTGAAHPTRGEYASWLADLASRGCRILHIVTGSFRTKYNYPEQFWDTFPELRGNPAIAHFYQPQYNHTFTSMAAQEWLSRTIAEWAEASAGEVRSRRNQGE